MPTGTVERIRDYSHKHRHTHRDKLKQDLTCSKCSLNAIDCYNSKYIIKFSQQIFSFYVYLF